MCHRASILSTAVVVALVGCGNSGRGSSDPATKQLRALESLAVAADEQAELGGGTLVPLGEALESRLTSADVTVFVSNYLALLESLRTGAAWQPDADFYALIDRLRDLPLMSDMPQQAVPDADPATPKGAEGPMASRESALVLSNVSPSCAMSCRAQAIGYGLADLAVSKVSKYYADLLAGGVDCVQDAMKMGKCVATNTCTWGDFVLFVGGCAATSGSVALEVSGATKAKAAYALLKLTIGMWSAGSLGLATQTWAEQCLAFQAASCPALACPEPQTSCVAVTGAAALCCPAGISCGECSSCTLPCGSSCCALGQRCDVAVCTTCASACGPTCCAANEVCVDAAAGVCAICDSPCGNACCAAGETCDAKSSTCRAPRPVGCTGGPSYTCSTLCQEAAQSALQKCTAMGGTMQPINVAGCVEDCECVLLAVPHFFACGANPACDGCDELEAVMKGCALTETVCRVPR